MLPMIFFRLIIEMENYAATQKEELARKFILKKKRVRNGNEVIIEHSLTLSEYGLVYNPLWREIRKKTASSSGLSQLASVMKPVASSSN